MTRLTLVFSDTASTSAEANKATDEQAVDMAAREAGDYGTVQIWNGDRLIALLGNPRNHRLGGSVSATWQPWSARDTGATARLRQALPSPCGNNPRIAGVSVATSTRHLGLKRPPLIANRSSIGGRRTICPKLCGRRLSAWPDRPVPKLLAMPKDTIVTLDALNCQRAIAAQIVDQGGKTRGHRTT
jgi:hypothetical protein